jgi:SAM-dependent methyltransferase
MNPPKQSNFFQGGSGPGVFSRDFWVQTWKEVHASSVIHQTQRSSPDAWLQFYDAVSPCWLQMFGEGLDLGRRVAEVLLNEHLVRSAGTALDLGCGPGALSLALAERRVSVEAVDNSRGMIRCVEKTARRLQLSSLRASCRQWEELEPNAFYDLVAAAFFPPAMSPEGIERMESFSRDACALVLGTGEDPLPFRRQLWSRLIQATQPAAGRHLVCAVNYLLATGRSPGVKHLQWPFTFDVRAKAVRAYFTEYFALYGKTPAEIEEALDAVLPPYLERRRIRATGWHSIAVVWWRKPPYPPNLRKETCD